MNGATIRETKKGEKRQEVDVTLCFGPLLRWILSWWPTQMRSLALGMDATTRASRFTVLAISVLYRGCAIPVAWKIVRSHEKGSWEPYWKGLFTVLQGGVPADWTVIVLRDSRAVCSMALQAHRISGLASFSAHQLRRQGTSSRNREMDVAFDSCTPYRNSLEWLGGLLCGQDTPLYTVGTASMKAMLIRGLILTDLASESADVVWYAMRTWIEGGFKDTCTLEEGLGIKLR